MLAGTIGVGLAWVVVLGFLRITTHRAILVNPLSVTDVLDRLASWLALPHVHVPAPSSRHFELLRDLLGRIGRARRWPASSFWFGWRSRSGAQVNGADCWLLPLPEMNGNAHFGS